MWLQEQLHPTGPAQLVATCITLRGPLDKAALQVAIDKLVARHENLRVRFIVGSDGPVQQLPAVFDATVREIDLRLSGQAFADALHEEQQAPMDLQAGPLFRAALLVLAPHEHALLFTIHHLIVDHGSTNLLLRDFGALYQAAVTHEPDPLAPLTLTYSSHARAAAQAGVDDAAKAYWAREMAALPAPLMFATGQRIVPTGRRSAGTVVRTLDVTSASGLRRLGGDAGMTPFMVHLALCAVLMQRHTGAQDMVFGVPLSTRPDVAAPSLTGLFVNTLPLRLRFAPDVTFEALLHLVRVRLLRAMMHVNLPLHELIGMLRLERHRGSNPLFQVCVNHATAAPQPHSAGGCDVEVLALPSLKAAFEANIILIEGADGPKVCLEFDGDALSAADAEDILDQYECALACVARGPSLAIRDILLLQAPPRQASAEPRPAFVPVHARFEQQAARTPDAIAVIWCTHRSSYAELNARANRLAARLIDLGVGRGSLVAVCTDRRPEMVLAVLAVLKVGAAFVPVDQDNPDERLRFILDDTQARVLLTSTTLWHRFGQMPAMVVCADDDAACATYAAHDPGVAIDPADLAYGVYTSGSTGQPKCALNTHGGFANLLNWYTTGLSMPADARVMLASSFGFDMTQKSLLGPLCVGAQLMMPGCRPAEHHAFTHALAACRPTWLSCAPSAFRSFMDSPATESIGTLVLGGEPLDGAIVSALRGKAVTLVNSYGPSECSDIAIWCARSMHLADADDTAMPLGRPVPHVRIHVLDERLRQVPTGVTGDLYIAGAGVGRGYLHRPDLTAERFLPDPFGEPGSRMYKTGDLGRRRRDGVFEYLGRADDQVKLRGNRVEPGEVENSLRACDGVKECVVMLRELAPGESHLVAYIVARDAHMIDTDTLRHALRRQLPDYMVPTAWVTLPALPLNLNGKVDRKALPLPLRGPDTERAITLPRTPTEACLADIWKTVLDVPQVCVFDNFFDLWGQSLLAVKVAALVAQRLGVPLPTRAIFDAENLAALAALIDQTPAVKVTPACQPIKRQARQPMGQGVPEAPIT